MKMISKKIIVRIFEIIEFIVLLCIAFYASYLIGLSWSMYSGSLLSIMLVCLFIFVFFIIGIWVLIHMQEKLIFKKDNIEQLTVSNVDNTPQLINYHDKEKKLITKELIILTFILIVLFAFAISFSLLMFVLVSGLGNMGSNPLSLFGAMVISPTFLSICLVLIFIFLCIITIQHFVLQYKKGKGNENPN